MKIRDTAAAISSALTFRAFSTVDRRLRRGVMETNPVEPLACCAIGTLKQDTRLIYKSMISVDEYMLRSLEIRKCDCLSTFVWVFSKHA